MKIYVIGRVVTFHLKSGESHSEQINEGLGGNQAFQISFKVSEFQETGIAVLEEQGT